ncbi:MAG TPA: hypothetical protein VNA28_12020, partial [Solirubrobacteraceae bacterium]|nr:hypothetical protein [Solirubrobacteraceae bacterium]
MTVIANAIVVLRGAAEREPQGGGPRMLRPHSVLAVLPLSLVLASGARSRLPGADRFAARRGRWVT